MIKLIQSCIHSTDARHCSAKDPANLANFEMKIADRKIALLNRAKRNSDKQFYPQIAKKIDTLEKIKAVKRDQAEYAEIKKLIIKKTNRHLREKSIKHALCTQNPNKVYLLRVSKS
jgi:hypothetical protein